jgi:hypothetical protein
MSTSVPERHSNVHHETGAFFKRLWIRNRALPEAVTPANEPLANGVNLLDGRDD